MTWHSSACTFQRPLSPGRASALTSQSAEPEHPSIHRPDLVGHVRLKPLEVDKQASEPYRVSQRRHLWGGWSLLDVHVGCRGGFGNGPFGWWKNPAGSVTPSGPRSRRSLRRWAAMPSPRGSGWGRRSGMAFIDQGRDAYGVEPICAEVSDSQTPAEDRAAAPSVVESPLHAGVPSSPGRRDGSGRAG